MKKVTGIGGIFFKCKDPDKIKEWYKIHLGLDTDQYGTSFDGGKVQTLQRKVLLNGAHFRKLQNILNLPQKSL